MTRSGAHHTATIRQERRLFPAFWLIVWLALAGLFASPVIASAHALQMAAADSGSPICHAPGSDGPASPDHGKLAACDMCVCCAPVAALAESPPHLPLPRLILLAAPETPSQPRAPPGLRVAAAFPRGPPASL